MIYRVNKRIENSWVWPVVATCLYLIAIGLFIANFENIIAGSWK